MPNNFLFMLLKSWTRENLTDLHYCIAEGIIIFQFNLDFCRHSSSTFEQKHLFWPRKVVLHLLQPLSRGALRCLYIGVMVP